MIILSILISFAICFCICSISSQPVHAIAGVDDAVLWVLGMVCFSLAINITADPIDWGDTFEPLYNALSDTAKQELFKVSFLAGLGTSYIFDFSPQMYGQLTSEIIDYFNSPSYNSSSQYTDIVPTSSDGKIGFTSSTLFHFTYPLNAPSCSVRFPSGSLTIYWNISGVSFPLSFDRSYYDHAFLATNDDGFSFLQAYHEHATFDPASTGYTFYSRSYSDVYRSCITPDYCNIMNLFDGFYKIPVFYDSNGNLYDLRQINGLWRFVDRSDSSHFYNDLSFSNQNAVAHWFYNSFGLVTPYSSDVPAYSGYVPDSDSGFEYDDSSATDSRTTNLNKAQSDGSLSLVIPANRSDLTVLTNNPNLVTDVESASDVLTLVDSNNINQVGFTTISGQFNSLIDFLSNFWDNLVGLFVPPPDFWNGDFFSPVIVAIENKFTWLAGLENWLELFNNTQGQPLYFEFNVKDIIPFIDYVVRFDFAWYEPHRLNIRACFSVLFFVVATLHCLRLITRAFNIPIADIITIGGDKGDS